MRFTRLDERDLRYSLNELTKMELIRIIDFVDEFVSDKISTQFEIEKKHLLRKNLLVDYLKVVFTNEIYIGKIYAKLSSSKVSNFIYKNLIWEVNFIDTAEITDKFDYRFNRVETIHYGVNEKYLDDNLSFVKRRKSHYYNNEDDLLILDSNIRTILKLVYPIPEYYELESIQTPDKTQFTYSNEEGIFNFINVISEMLKNNLIEFGKTNEKPLAKTLNILKNSTGIHEFYGEKKLDSFATDMLTRSFSYYYWESKRFKDFELESLKDFVLKQMDDRFYFFIARIFASHLKKVRYDNFYSSQKELFDILKIIMADMPKDGWVGMENILKYCNYRDMKFDFESAYKTENYNIECDILSDETRTDTFYVGGSYNILFFEPIIKASFFYLGSLGLFELKYDDPISPYKIVAKGKEYISTWDSLKYVKITELGKYVFGLVDFYEQKIIEKKSTEIKFDEYKPIITIDSKDTITQAKLESYTDKYDENRYILSYAKIFKDCKTKKILELKIDGFYKQIEPNPPQVFKDFFDEIKQNQNLLKRDLKQVVIELSNNKKLLNLFMKNKKLQELVIKAQGFRVIVLKENIPKLTKIVKDNGFFVEF